jgi:hypothetical protein
MRGRISVEGGSPRTADAAAARAAARKAAGVT